MMDADIVCEQLVRIYAAEGIEVQALQGLDLIVDTGDLVAIVGASGSGKSTLLNILSGLDTPTAGKASVAGVDLLNLSGRARVNFQRRTVGFVWQHTSANLLSYLTAIDNVLAPMSLAGNTDLSRAHELLDIVGLADHADRRPEQLSGGQQQRAAIAVALANSPRVLLADEPTGQLDEEASAQVLRIFEDVNTHLGTTVLIVTHDDTVAHHVRRTIQIRDGRTSREVLRRKKTDHTGTERHVAEEFAVLDRAGRMQLPKEFVETLELRDRVRLALEPDHIGVWGNPPDQPNPPGQQEEQ